MVTGPAAPATTRVAGLNCPNCGASIALSTAGWSVSVVCSTCGAVLDAQDPNLHVLQRQSERILVKPRIPLGSRGEWRGIKWEVVGFQQVSISVESETYSWLEYVCFNPYNGFLYLTEYEGHWNVVEKLHKRPTVAAGTQSAFDFDGHTYKHFQSASASTTFALGEFPWEVSVGDRVGSHDYVSPPYLLSAESTDLETTWSLGTYTEPEAIGRAFGIGNALRAPVGVFANQPNPHWAAAAKVSRVFRVFLLALVAMLIANVALARKEAVFNGQFRYDRASGDTVAFVTDPFELKGRTSNVDVSITTNLDNNWLWFGIALIDEASGQTYDVGREVSFYHGSDSDGSWTEGSQNDHFKLGSVPPGRYILRVGPEQGDNPGENSLAPVSYSLRIRRDVPSYLFYLFAFIALSVPALLAYVPAATFEQRRWAESDHGTSISTDSSDDDSSDDDD